MTSTITEEQICYWIAVSRDPKLPSHEQREARDSAIMAFMPIAEAELKRWGRYRDDVKGAESLAYFKIIDRFPLGTDRSVMAYAHKVIRHALVNERYANRYPFRVRKADRQQNSEEVDFPSNPQPLVLHSLADERPDERQVADQHELRDALITTVRRRMGRVTPKQKDVVVRLFGMAGGQPMSLGMLARAMGTTKHAVAAARDRALANLRGGRGDRITKLLQRDAS